MIKIKKIVMWLMMFCGFISFFSIKVQAAEEKNDVIKQIYLTDSNGNRPSDDKFNKKDTVQVNIVWSVPDNSAVKGDYFAFTLPDILSINKDLDFELKDEDGEVVATAHLNSQTKRVVVTFSDYVEKYSNVNGTMRFNAVFDKDKIDGENDYHIEFTQDDGTVFDEDITVTDEEKPFDRFDEVLRKFGYFDKNDPNVIHWVIRVNVKGIDIHDAMLTDEIGEGHSLVRDSLKVSKLKYKVIDGKLEYEDMRDVTSESNIEIPNDNKFIIYFGDILDGYGYYINYDTRLVGDGNESNTYKNKVSLIGNDEEIIENTETHKVIDGDGDAEGDTGILEIIKKDSKEKEKFLSGAEFDILDSDKKVVAHVVTDEKGKASVKDLKYGFYQLVETKAPEGYKLDETPKDFIIGEARETISLEIENTKSEDVDPLGSLDLTKVDSKDKEKFLSGAEFDILDSDKKVVAHVVTDEKGKASVKDLKYGFYQLVETKAPEGYKLDETPIDFSISSRNNSAELIVKNSKIKQLTPNEQTENDKNDKKTNQEAKPTNYSLPKTNEKKKMTNIAIFIGIILIFLESIYVCKKTRIK